MYQHLFATACLLTAQGRFHSVCVERDEDIEIISDKTTRYIQVKTRSNPLLFKDIEGALKRFSLLRDEHQSNKRSGSAQFIFVSNVAPSDALLRRLDDEPLKDDVSIVWPDGLRGPQPEDIPPAWRDILAAVEWCIFTAEQLHLRLIASESLVWKVAAHAALAASGTAPYEDHTFVAEELPALFEQILIQLQEFPEPLQHYRPLQDQPPLEAEAHLRVICGFSGSGKTSWAAQMAAHSAAGCVYYDTAGTPDAALAGALVRESAAQLRLPHVSLEKILLPGATGLQSLRALDEALSRAILPPYLIIDNAQNLAADTLYQISGATRHVRLILLSHPVPMVAELEARTGVTREDLKGWSLEDVAAEASAVGSRGSIATMERLRQLTSGYPLYVQGAARLAVTQYGGDLSELCTSLERGIHPVATPQEAILARTFEILDIAERDAVAFLSLSDVPLGRDEASLLLRDCMKVEEASGWRMLRQLRMYGFVQISVGGSVRVHDALRILGKLYLQSNGAEAIKKGCVSLRSIFFWSLHERKDISRLGAFARLLASMNDLEPLIELIGEELFHEMGVMPEVVDAMERALVAGELSPDQQYWAHDGIVFAAMKHGGGVTARDVAQRSLRSMEELVAQGHIAERQQGSLWMKKMLFEAENRNVEGVLQALRKAEEVLPNDREYLRIYEYNTAHALFWLGRYDLAEELTEPLIREYYKEVGVSPDLVVGVKQDVLRATLAQGGADWQDIKHLADCLELLALTRQKQGAMEGLARIHAMRFYQIVGAVDSVVRTGLDVADGFVRRNDFVGARQVMEEHVLPFIREYRLISKFLDARSLYAVILAYSGDINEAEREMERLAPLVDDAPPEMQKQISMQKKLIAELRITGGPTQWQLPQALTKSDPLKGAFERQFAKPGRNEPCPCGSGRKFKKCHGAS
jgi:tetratricopeptide (TPR) repeat protein